MQKVSKEIDYIKKSDFTDFISEFRALVKGANKCFDLLERGHSADRFVSIGENDGDHLMDISKINDKEKELVGGCISDTSEKFSSYAVQDSVGVTWDKTAQVCNRASSGWVSHIKQNVLQLMTLLNYHKSVQAPVQFSYR